MDTGVMAGDEDWSTWMKERAEFQAWLWAMKETNESRRNHKGRSYFNASRLIYWRKMEGQKDVQGQRRERNVRDDNKQLGFSA